MHRKAACVVVAKALGRPVVLHVHAGAGDLAVFHRRLGTLRRRAFRAVLHLADRVLSVSAPSAHELEERFGAPRVDVLPNAAPPAVSLNERAPQEVDGNLLYVGGFANPVKGGEVLLEALPLILRELPLARVVLAGPGEPPQRVKELGPRVAAVGWLDAEQKARAIREAQVFVLPSTSEGLPVALLEAMAYGKPIVASAVGGIPDVVTAGVEALLVPAGRPDALAEAILTLAGDDELRKRLARGALAAAQRLSPRVVDEKLEAVYGALSR
jgi:glycosyltransferase involved in cell wall biosynthesis